MDPFLVDFRIAVVRGEAPADLDRVAQGLCVPDASRRRRIGGGCDRLADAGVAGDVDVGVALRCYVGVHQFA